MPDLSNAKSPVRKVVEVVATGLSISGVGLGMLLTGWHPLIGVGLMVVGAAYLLYELLMCPPIVRVVPEGMLRLVAGVMIGAFTLLIVGPDIEKTLYRFPGPGTEKNPEKEPESKEPPKAPVTPGPPIHHSCRVVSRLISEPVARVCARGTMPVSGDKATLAPYLQEIFYEWTLVLTATKQTSDASVVIRTSYVDRDHLRVTPDTALVSELKPGWMSGFDEPERTPDFYLRTIRFPILNRNISAKITLRRPIRLTDIETHFSLPDFLRTYDVTSADCTVIKETPTLPEAEAFTRAMKQVFALGTWKYSGATGNPLKTKRDPDDPQPPLAANEVEATTESRCQNVNCTKLAISQLEVRKGH